MRVQHKLIIREKPRALISTPVPGLPLPAPHGGISEPRRRVLPAPRCSDQVLALHGLGKQRKLWVIANGPSVPRLIPATKPDDTDILLINRPYMPYYSQASYWCVNDHAIWNAFHEKFLTFPGYVISSQNVHNTNKKGIRIKSLNKFSLDLQKGFHIGYSTTYSSMQVGYYLGYEEIHIFGCDMAFDSKMYFDDSKAINMDRNSRGRRFDIEAKSYRGAASYLPLEVRKKFHFHSDLNKYEWLKSFGPDAV